MTNGELTPRGNQPTELSTDQEPATDSRMSNRAKAFLRRRIPKVLTEYRRNNRRRKLETVHSIVNNEPYIDAKPRASRKWLNKVESGQQIIAEGLSMDSYSQTLSLETLGNLCESKYPPPGEIGLQIVDSNFDLISSMINDSYLGERAIRVIAQFVRFGDDDQQTRGLAVLETHRQVITEKVKAYYQGHEQISVNQRYYVDALVALLKSRTPNIANEAEAILTDQNIIPRHEYVRQILKNIADEEFYQKLIDYLKNTYARYGLDFDELLNVWIESGPNPAHTANLNLDTIEKLAEATRDGAPSSLIEHFGIQNFARYPVDMLSRQLYLYDEITAGRIVGNELKYGILLSAKRDWNGSLVHYKAVYEKTYPALRENGHETIVVECGNKAEIKTRLRALRELFGTDASFGIIDGHGERKSIHFGQQGEEDFALETEDLKMEMGGEIKESFEYGATLILGSCSSGQRFGIAAEFAKLGLRVIAPKKPTSIQSIAVVITDRGKLDFYVRYLNLTKRWLDSVLHSTGYFPPERDISRIYEPKNTR